MKARRRTRKRQQEDIGPQIAKGMFRVVDRHYRHLVEVAKGDWERAHPGSDPRDPRIKIRIRSGQARALSGVSKTKRKNPLPAGKSSVAPATS